MSISKDLLGVFFPKASRVDYRNDLVASEVTILITYPIEFFRQSRSPLDIYEAIGAHNIKPPVRFAVGPYAPRLTLRRNAGFA